MAAALGVDLHAPPAHGEAGAAGAAFLSPREYYQDGSTMLSTRQDAYDSVPRAVTQVLDAQEQPEGQGAIVRRSVGSKALRMLDPFLMLDFFIVAPPGGFPPHPHRGYETVTYMIEGSFCHDDFTGRGGVLAAGDVHWLTAGSGVVHSEMPNEERLNAGLQLWVNLPKAAKMCPPRSQELRAAQVPLGYSPDGQVAVRVLAGEAFGVPAAISTHSPLLVLSFAFQPAARLNVFVPPGYNACAYVISGSAVFGAERTPAAAHQLVVLGEQGSDVYVEAGYEQELHFMFLAGKPLGEPVEQHGPFIMNDEDEVLEAISDFQEDKNGFEGARVWSQRWERPESCQPEAYTESEYSESMASEYSRYSDSVASEQSSRY